MESEDSIQDRPSRISRRESLKVGGGGVAGLSGIPFLSPAHMTEIVVTKDSGGPVRTKRVPTKWWNLNLKARHAAEKLNQRYSKFDSVESITRTGGNRKIGQYQAPVINVEVKQNATPPVVPDTINGVRVQTTRADEAELLACNTSGCYNTGTYDPVPGGLIMGTSDGCKATCSLQVYKDGDSSPYMLHAKHIWGNCTDPVGEQVYHQGQYCGEITYHGYTRDWVLIDWDSSGDLNNGYTSGIRRSDHRRVEEVTAWYTESGMEELAMNNLETVYKQGTTTGITEGQVTSIVELGFRLCSQQ